MRTLALLCFAASALLAIPAFAVEPGPRASTSPAASAPAEPTPAQLKAQVADLQGQLTQAKALLAVIQQQRNSASDSAAVSTAQATLLAQAARERTVVRPPTAK